MSEFLTREQAVALADSKWWIGLPAQHVVEFQLFEDRLCMDFGDFHAAVKKALGRGVWSHEFADIERLRKEFLGERPAPTFTEIIALIPEEKRVVVGL